MFKFSVQWNNREFLIQIMIVTSFAYTMFFLPRINASLQCFQRAWNNHPLSTERNHSPMQLYTGGSVGSSLLTRKILLTYKLIASIDPDALSPEEDEESTVTVPEVEIGANLQTLRATIDPLRAV